MSKTIVEIDFFQMEKLNSASSTPSSPEFPPSSFRGIQNVVSRINPQLLKTVMAAEQARSPPSSSLPSPTRVASPPLLLSHAPSSRSSSPVPADAAPLTIFYNGTVTTVTIPRHKAEALMRMAETEVKRSEEALKLDGHQLGRDLPIARRKSLHRFLEKRKERQASASPYHKSVSASPL